MTAKRVSYILIVVLCVYLLIAGSQAIRLIGSGSALAMGLGFALLILPFLGLWILWREIQFGIQVEKMGRQLADEGGLLADDLPRATGGGVDRDAADAQFEQVKHQVEADPGDWRSWYRLAASYDAARDRKRARAAMYHAIDLYRGVGKGSVVDQSGNS